jgi:hypothetical protein
LIGKIPIAIGSLRNFNNWLLGETIGKIPIIHRKSFVLNRSFSCL